MRFTTLGACSALIVMATTAATGARGEAVADFYKGKTVNIYIGFGPGGGYDTYTRVLARHFGRFIPGNPTVRAAEHARRRRREIRHLPLQRGTARWHRAGDVRRLQWARTALRQCPGGLRHGEVHLDRKHEPRRFGLRGLGRRRLQRLLGDHAAGNGVRLVRQGIDHQPACAGAQEHARRQGEGDRGLSGHQQHQPRHASPRGRRKLRNFSVLGADELCARISRMATCAF